MHDCCGNCKNVILKKKKKRKQQIYIYLKIRESLAKEDVANKCTV